MKRILRGLAVGCAFWAAATTGIAANAPAPKAAPVVRFAEPAFDFGKVMPNEMPRHEFRVTNAGTAPLVISAVSPGCGCTTTSEWDREIAPGASGRIPIQFNPANFSGAVSKQIVVTTNDPAQPSVLLEIKATVWRPLDVQPAFATFLPVEDEPKVETKSIRIVSSVEGPVTLEPPLSSDPRFKTELKTVRPGREFELLVSYDSAQGGSTPASAITIKTSHPDQSLLTVSAFAMSQPAIVTVPAMIQLPDGVATPRDSYNITIRQNGAGTLRLTAATATDRRVAVKVTEAQVGKIFYVNVSFPEGFKASAAQPVVVTVKTSHPKYAEIRVPILPSSTTAAAGH